MFRIIVKTYKVTKMNQTISRESMSKLKYTDLAGLLARIGEKGIAPLIYRAMLETHKIYGSSYVVERMMEYAGDPRAYGIDFPSRVGKLKLISQFIRLYGCTKDENYCMAIEKYTNDLDSSVSKTAQLALNGLGRDAAAIDAVL